MARSHVLFDDDVLEAIDDKVGQRGRSRFLEEAAPEKLERASWRTPFAKVRAS